MASEVAKIEPRDMTPMKEVTKRIADMGQQLKSVLPSHIDTAKFQRVVMTAIQTDPGLLDADRASLFVALTKAATDGLLPDKREGALTIAKTKVKERDPINGLMREVYKDMVVWMPMVAGIVKKVRQSGEVASMTAKAVYEKDEFDILYGDDDRIFHRPFMEGHPGKIVGAYSIVRLKDGTISRDFMPKWRIEKAQAAAKTKYVWDAWPDEMAVKTVIRHHAKLLPQSTDIEAAFERDDTVDADLAGTTAAMLTSRQPERPTGRALLEASLADDETQSTEGASSPAIVPEQAPAVSVAAGEQDKAVAWANSYRSKVEGCFDRADLAELQHKYASKLADMKAKRSDLHARCTEAEQAQLASFDQAAGDDDFPGDRAFDDAEVA